MEIFTITPKLRKLTMGELLTVTGYYVYEWADGKHVFYVGSGKNRRAWDKHRPHIYRYRCMSLNFQIRILEDNLTKPKSLVLEHDRIVQLFNKGHHLLNVQKMPKSSRYDHPVFSL